MNDANHTEHPSAIAELMADNNLTTLNFDSLT